jgi:thiamine kinase-like enzyme
MATYIRTNMQQPRGAPLNLCFYICAETSPEPTDKYATLSHGDCKAMNFFLPISNNNNKNNNRGVILVDFASTGVGLGMSDVAMLIHHAIRPEHLDNGGEMMLVDHYIDKLNDLLLLKQQQQQTHDVNDTTMNTTTRPIKQILCYYPKEIALWHYKLAVADYFRFFLGRFWKSATPESFEKKKYSKNTAFINRDRDSAFAFIKRVKKYVTEIEEVKKSII